MVAWEAWRGVPIEVAGNPLANATFSRVTNWEGTEEHAEISPDGRFVAFLADQAGQLDVWVSQVGTGRFDNLTRDIAPDADAREPAAKPGIQRRRFGDLVQPHWESRRSTRYSCRLTGGTPRPFLHRGHSTPSWSPDNARLAFIDAIANGDPLFHRRPHRGESRSSRRRSTRQGAVCQGRRAHTQSGVVTRRRMDLLRARDGTDRQDGRVAHATVGRIAGAAHSPARRREFPGAARSAHAALCGTCGRLVRAVAVGPRRGEQGHASSDRGPRAIHVGVRQPGRPSRGRDRGQAHSQPLARASRDRRIEDRDVQPYPVPTERALAPRFAGTSLFYLSLSTRGTGDGLWRGQNGRRSK